MSEDDDGWVEQKSAPAAKPSTDDDGWVDPGAKGAASVGATNKGAPSSAAIAANKPAPTWSDALKYGLANAVPFSHDIGAGIQAGETYLPKWAATDDIGETDPNASFSDRFHQQKHRINSEDARISSAFPTTSLVTPIVAGGLALPIEGPVAGVANAARYVAPRLGSLGASALGSGVVGAGLGAAYGAGNGDSLDERLKNAKSGALWGGGLGAAAPAISEAAGTALSKLGLTSPKAEAAKAIGQARDPSAALPSSDVANALNANQPITVADVLGGGQLRRLADKAAVGSPEAQQTIRNAVESRFNEQGDRANAFLQNLFGSNLNATEIMEDLSSKAKIANSTNYKAAFSSPSAQSVWDPDLQNLIQSPSVRKAIGDANRVSQEESVLHRSRTGASGPMLRNPFVTDANGNLTLPPGVTPNLQFWDIVKRNLDSQYDSSLTGLGKPTNGSRLIGGLRSALIKHLDNAVPEYAQARAGAAGFFGENDAFTAGMKYLSKKNALQSSGSDAALNALTAPQKALFSQGVAADMAQKAQNANTRTNALRQFNDPATAAKLRKALGPYSDKVESFMRVEDRMDQLRQALGNSLTAQRVTDQGHGAQPFGHGFIGSIAQSLGPTAGGALVGAAGAHEAGQDAWKGAVAGAGYGFAAQHGANHRRAINEAIANMLMEGDPAKVANTAAAIAAKPSLMKALRGFVPRAAVAAPSAINNNTQPQGQLQPAYASGGAVKRKSHEELVSRLMGASEKAKASTKRDTKAILGVPDNTVARALAIAQKSI